jgi:hypothetical protein
MLFTRLTYQLSPVRDMAETWILLIGLKTGKKQGRLSPALFCNQLITQDTYGWRSL